MNCVIPSLNVKVIAKALQALSKVGDDLFMEARRDHLSFVSLNLSKTVCVRYNFLDSFFSSYEVNENELNADNVGAIKCKILMKILLPLFKGNYLEKKLEWIKFEYQSNDDIMLFKIKYKCDDIIMLHKLRLMEPESLTIQIDTESGCNNICAPSSFYNQILSMFSNSDDEITLEISKEKVVARNYFVGAPYRPKSVRSQVNLNASEFNIFRIATETSVNFSLKPFRTAIQFAEGFNLNIGFNFEVGGRPLAMVMKNPTFEVNFIVATLNPYNDTQSTLTTASIPTKLTQMNNDQANLTVEDQQALENENWDDFNMDVDRKESTSSKSSKKASFKELMDKIKQSKKKKNDENGVSLIQSRGENNKENFTTAVDERLSEDEINGDNNDMEVVQRSPESPRSKKAKLVFGRCFDPTFHGTMLGEVLAANSDSE